MRIRSVLVAAAALVGALAGLLVNAVGQAAVASGVPTPDHVVVVVFENHAYTQILGSGSAPYFDQLSAGGATLTASYGITHPSQPNYMALFSGSTQGITDDSCYTPGSSTAANLASELIAAGKTWASYNDALPGQGSTVCTSGTYRQKHNPWFMFGNVPTSSAYPFSQFPSDYSQLPQVSFVVPDICNDMHDCSVGSGDTWLKNNLGAYATWAQSHNSVLAVTFDEDDSNNGNRIATLFYGQPVTPGSTSSATYSHYNLLRTIEDMYGTSHAGNAATASPITGIWTTGTPTPTPTPTPTGTPTPTPTNPVGLSGTHAIVTSGKALDDPAFSSSQGTQLITWSPNGGSNQNWVFTQQTDGSYQIVNGFSNLCMDVSGASTSAGAQVIQWACHGGSNQRWLLAAVSGGYTITAQHSGLLLTTASTSDGSLVTQQLDTGSALQRWTIN